MNRINKTPILLAIIASVMLVGTAASAVTLAVGNGAGMVGDTIVVPVTLADVTEPVWSVEMDFSWYWPYMTFTGVQTTGTISEPWFFEYLSASGSGQVVFAGSEPLVAGGILCYLEFRLDAGNGNIALNLINGVINEDEGAVDLLDGTINITALPTVDVFPDTGELVVGENLTFNTYGGTAPYSYTSSNPAVAEFEGGSNILHGVSPGTVQVFTEDDNGVSNATTGVITVLPFRLQVLDSSGTEGQPVLVPLLLNNPAPYGIVSAEIDLSWYAAYGVFNQVITSGTLLEAAGWSAPVVNSEAGTLRLTMAGSNPLPSAGVLCFLEFTFTNSLTLNVEPGIFNEVYQAFPDDGYITISPLPSLTLTPYTSHLLVGEYLQLELSGSPTFPLDYIFFAPSVITVTSDGLVSAHASGWSEVWVYDFLGARSNNVHIEVYDLALPPLAMAIHADETVSIPVKVSTRLEELDIYSLELSVDFNPYYVEFLGVSTVGSATEDWGAALAVNDGGTVRVYHAGSSSLEGCPAGLVYLEFLGLPTIGSIYNGITLESALFNEGSPRVLLNSRIPCVASAVQELPRTGLRLLPNHPNPFNPGTTIGYEVGERGGAATLSVFSSRGQLVRRLLDEPLTAGARGQVYWDGRDEKGRLQPSGVYFSRLAVADQQVMQKMVLIK